MENGTKLRLLYIYQHLLRNSDAEHPVSTPELMIRTAKCLPNCKLVIHSGYGHVLDIFEELADDAVRFYENVVNTGRYYTPVDNTPIEGIL